MKNIIFDLGGVLIDWNPRIPYSNIFKTEAEIDTFFQNICTPDWNEEQDAGRSLQEATETLVAQHPQWEKEIKVYYGQWQEMLVGPIPETVQLFQKLKSLNQYKFYALTNWSAETFPVALARYDFLHWFDGRLVSGEERMRKPAPEFYQLLLDRFQIDPSQSIFIDDNLRNIKAAQALGVKSIHFHSAKQLEKELSHLNIL